MCHISRGLLACNGMKNEVAGGLKRYFIDKASFAINKRVIKSGFTCGHIGYFIAQYCTKSYTLGQ